MPTASLLIIGNEILSGRTADKNLQYLAVKLEEQGVRLQEVRVVRDVEADIITAINTLRAQYDTVFTSGGIGPTHDDITTAAIAKAFEVPLHQHPEALAALQAYYKPADLNAARLKMALLPIGATLIPNPLSNAPGFQLENVAVMAGVPRIFQAMVDFVVPALVTGDVIHNKTVTTHHPEGTIAAFLEELELATAGLSIGSYPFFTDVGRGTNIVLRSTVLADVEAAQAALEGYLEGLGIT
jgi:molybdenum cofactor synthesis domain-containing protein